MGFRHRNGFDGVSDMPREDLNLTKYDEKLIVQSGRLDRRSEVMPEVQSPVQTPAPDPNERSYVFDRPAASGDGRDYLFGGGNTDSRASVFGAPDKSQYTPPAPAPAPAPQTSAFAPSQTAERPMVFVMRDDRDMYVYEYSDRLEYFRRTNVGMVHCATKFRTGKRG